MQNEEDLEPSEWGTLPSCALERVFSHLNTRDRASASIVCKSWAETYESPSLWKTATLSFSKGNRIRPCFNPQSIVHRFGQYFRKLTILCRNEYRRAENFSKKQINDFFGMLVEEEVELEGIRMPRLMILSHVINNQTIVVRENVIKFLKMQTRLTDVDFSGGDTHTLPCLMILENLVAEKVQDLKLQNFFHFVPEIFSPLYHSRYLAAITRFHGLRSLWLNYRYLRNEVMINLAINLEGQLEVFGVLYEKCNRIAHNLSEDSWLALKTKCPKMEVYARIELRRMITNLFLNGGHMPSEMPLVSVQIIWDFYWFPPWDHAILRVLMANFGATLREITLEAGGRDESDIRSGIIELVRHCPRLENLTVRLRFPSFKIQVLYDSMLGTLSQMNKEMTSLKVFRATFRKLTREQRARRMQLQSTYIPRFNAIGVQLIMKIKK